MAEFRKVGTHYSLKGKYVRVYFNKILLPTNITPSNTPDGEYHKWFIGHDGRFAFLFSFKHPYDFYTDSLTFKFTFLWFTFFFGKYGRRMYEDHPLECPWYVHYLFMRISGIKRRHFLSKYRSIIKGVKEIESWNKMVKEWMDDPKPRSWINPYTKELNWNRAMEKQRYG